VTKDPPINQTGPLARPTEVTAWTRSSAIWKAEPEDRDRIARAAAGDRAALRALAEAELPRVERLLGRILGPRHDFEDHVQIALLEMCRALPSFRGGSRFSTFVGGIVVRVARRALRPTEFVRTSAPMREDFESEDADPERAAIAVERLRRLHAALDRLTPAKRIAFTLWALEGLSPEEIGELTDAKLHTVRSRIFHARKELMADPNVRDLVEEEP
jgi:RNA polymerase sigma-70 factor (ECF subfamily)